MWYVILIAIMVILLFIKVDYKKSRIIIDDDDNECETITTLKINNKMIDFFNLLSVMEKGEPNVLYIDYTNDVINENFIGYLKETGYEIIYTVDVVEQNGEKFYKVIYKEYLDFGKKYIQYHIEKYPFADVLKPNIYTELEMNFKHLIETGEKIARSFFYTNEYLKYRKYKYDTFFNEYKDITAYVTKELKQYTDKEYCYDDYMKEVYVVRKYVIKHFQKLLEENTQYYVEIENDEDYTVLIINEK